MEPICSFCGKTRREVRKLIAGPAVWICNECIDRCFDVALGEEREATRLDLDRPHSTWNYRVIRHEDGSYALHEVHYDETGTPTSYSEQACGFVGESIAELVASVDLARQDILRRTILNVKDFAR